MKKLFIILSIFLFAFSCKKDTTNIDKVVGRWQLSRYEDNGVLAGQYLMDFEKSNDELNATIYDCTECSELTHYINKVNFNNDIVSFSYILQSGAINVSATLKDDTKLDGNWSDINGNGGDWIAMKK